MLLRLTAKTQFGQTILKQHGPLYEVKDLRIHHLKPGFHISSQKNTNDIRFVGLRPYRMWMPFDGNEDFDYSVVKGRN